VPTRSPLPGGLQRPSLGRRGARRTRGALRGAATDKIPDAVQRGLDPVRKRKRKEVNSQEIEPIGLMVAGRIPSRHPSGTPSGRLQNDSVRPPSCEAER
jgi:hypothetical protein